MEYRVIELGKLYLKNTYQFKHALDVIFRSFELEYKEDGIKSPRAILHAFHRDQARCVKESMDAFDTTPPSKAAGECCIAREYTYPIKGVIEGELTLIISMDTIVDIYNPTYEISVHYPEECQHSWNKCETALYESGGIHHA